MALQDADKDMVTLEKFENPTDFTFSFKQPKPAEAKKMIGLSKVKPVKKVDATDEMPLFSNDNDGEYVQLD